MLSVSLSSTVITAVNVVDVIGGGDDDFNVVVLVFAFYYGNEKDN